MQEKQIKELEIDEIAQKIVKLHLSYTNAPKTLGLIDPTFDNKIQLRNEILRNLKSSCVSKAFEILSKNYNISSELKQQLKKKEFMEFLAKNEFENAVNVGKEFLQDKDIEMYCSLGYKKSTNDTDDNLEELCNEEMCIEDGLTHKSAVWVLWMQYQTVIYYLNNL